MGSRAVWMFRGLEGLFAVYKPPGVHWKLIRDGIETNLLKGDDETAYREEVERAVSWCQDNDLVLNTKKTLETIIDFERNYQNKPPILINNDTITISNSTIFKFIRTNISILNGKSTASTTKTLLL